MFVFYSSFLLFSVLSPVATLTIRRKITSGLSNSQSLLADVAEEISFNILFFIFYTGVPLLVFKGIAWHILGLNLTWGATTKELDHDVSICSLFWEILRTLRLQFGVMFMYVGYIAMLYFVIGCGPWYGASPMVMLIVGHLITPFLMNPLFIYALRNRFCCCCRRSPPSDAAAAPEEHSEQKEGDA